MKVTKNCELWHTSAVAGAMPKNQWMRTMSSI